MSPWIAHYINNLESILKSFGIEKFWRFEQLQ